MRVHLSPRRRRRFACQIHHVTSRRTPSTAAVEPSWQSRARNITQASQRSPIAASPGRRLPIRSPRFPPFATRGSTIWPGSRRRSGTAGGWCQQSASHQGRAPTRRSDEHPAHPSTREGAEPRQPDSAPRHTPWPAQPLGVSDRPGPSSRGEATRESGKGVDGHLLGVRVWLFSSPHVRIESERIFPNSTLHSIGSLRC